MPFAENRLPRRWCSPRRRQHAPARIPAAWCSRWTVLSSNDISADCCNGRASACAPPPQAARLPAIRFNPTRRWSRSLLVGERMLVSDADLLRSLASTFPRDGSHRRLRARHGYLQRAALPRLARAMSSWCLRAQLARVVAALALCVRPALIGIMGKLLQLVPRLWLPSVWRPCDCQRRGTRPAFGPPFDPLPVFRTRMAGASGRCPLALAGLQLRS